MQLLTSYGKIAWRHLWKNKTHTAINILGLSIGMAVALLIGSWVWDELSFDHYHKNHGRIASILSISHLNGATGAGANSSVPLAAELKARYRGEFVRMSLMSWTTPTLTAEGFGGAGSGVRQAGGWVQPDYPYIFTLPMIDGSADALKDNSSILVSASLAKALFGSTAVTGRVIRWDDTLNFKVGGVYADPPDNVSLYPQFLAPWDNVANASNLDPDAWTNHHYQLYVQINDGASFETISAKIKDVTKPHIRGGWEEIGLYPMDRWRLYDRFENGKPVAGRLESVWTCGIIGVFVLLLACINFMNLSTARSEKRARETGGEADLLVCCISHLYFLSWSFGVGVFCGGTADAGDRGSQSTGGFGV